MYDVNATRQRNGIRNRIYVDAMPASGQTVVHTGGFATLDRQIVVDSYITATAFVRELRILAERFPSLMPERGANAHASSGRPFRRFQEAVALDRVIVSACHGDRYWLAIEHWAAHLAELDGSSIEIVSLDGGAYRGDVPGVSTVSMDVAGVKLQWGVGERYQIERIIWHLDHGRVGLHVDLDVRVKRAFSLPLSCLPYDMVISRSYGSPSFAVKKFGFAACLGFWLAKPAAKGLCEVWLRNILARTYRTDMDQDVFNAMLCECDPPRQETVRLGSLPLAMDVFEIEGCRIGVLPKEAVERNLDTTAIFGNHARPILDQFLWQAMSTHPLRAAWQLLSTSVLGPPAIGLRNFARRRRPKPA